MTRKSIFESTNVPRPPAANKDRMFFKERKRFKVASGQQIDLGTVVA